MVPFCGETDRIATCRYKILRPVSHPPNVHSFVGTARTNGAVPPAKNRSFTSIFRWYTHTHDSVAASCDMSRLAGSRLAPAGEGQTPRVLAARLGGQTQLMSAAMPGAKIQRQPLPVVQSFLATECNKVIGRERERAIYIYNIYIYIQTQ